MNRTVSVVVGFIGVLIAFIMFPMILDSTHDIKTDSITQDFANIETSADTTTATLTLHTTLFEDNIQSVEKVASNNDNDTPVAESYSASGQQLTIAGLTENTTRLLTVDYQIDALTDYSGLSGMAGVAPIILFAGLLVGGGLAIWSGFRS